MPAESEKQREFLNWKFGHAWVKKHHFDNKGPLPERVGSKKRKRRHNGPIDRMTGKYY
jgi:hypothetical protein